MKLLPRSAWTSTAPGGTALSGPVGDLFLHHSVGVRPINAGAVPAVLRAVREFHVNSRNMSDIAYCYAVTEFDTAYTLRGHRTGGHTFCCNSTSIAFVLLGNSDAMPAAAVDKVAAGMRWLRQHQEDAGNLTKGHRTRGHRDVGGASGGTACPGNALYARIPEIRKPLDQEEDDMGFSDFSEAAGKRWNELLSGEKKPKAGPNIPKNPKKRDAALGRRFADGIFAALKGHK